MNTFQAIVLGVFAVLAVLGVAIFASTSVDGKKDYLGDVVMWGPIPIDALKDVQSTISTTLASKVTFTYKEVPAADFDRTLTEAIANGQAPDLVLLPDDQFYKHKAQLLPFSPEALPARTFLDVFAERGEVFLLPRGTYALPLSIDPLVMYWNRDLVSLAGLSRVPKTWEEVVANTPLLTKKDARGNLLQSAITLGGAKNMPNEKGIVTALLLQVGDKVAAFDEYGQLRVTLGETEPSSEPSLSALRFYTEFGDPVKTVYTWNTALPDAQALFAQGKLALYIGYASELGELRAMNPNLNIDVALLPNREGAPQLTYGHTTGIAVMKAGKNPAGAMAAATTIVGAEISEKFMAATSIPSARRDVLGKQQKDPILATFAKAALLARGWVDPDQTRSSAIFGTLIDRILSGALPLEQALTEANRDLSALVQ